MQQLDKPVGEASVQECGEPMGMTPPMGQTTPPATPPSMSVNLNAQGLDNISDILKLIAKVNPDAEPKDAGLPSLGAIPSIGAAEPASPGIGSLGNLDAGPLKMLPDLDKEEPKDDNAIDMIQTRMGDTDHDGDRDLDDEPESDEEIGGALAGGAIGAIAGGPLGALTGAAAGDSLTDPDADEVGDEEEETEEETEEEAYGNSQEGGPGPDYKDADYMNNQLAGGMNKPKQMVKHSYRQGDNPMAMEGEDLRSWIHTQLKQRLEEAKGAK